MNRAAPATARVQPARDLVWGVMMISYRVCDCLLTSLA